MLIYTSQASFIMFKFLFRSLLTVLCSGVNIVSVSKHCLCVCLCVYSINVFLHTISYWICYIPGLILESGKQRINKMQKIP